MTERPIYPTWVCFGMKVHTIEIVDRDVPAPDALRFGTSVEDISDVNG